MNIRGYYSKFLFFLGLVLFACHKDIQTNTCVPTKSYLTPFVKQFQFKQGSYWIYSSSTNSHLDSMIVTQNNGWNSVPTPGPGLPGQANPNPNYCDSFQVSRISFSHMMFIGGGGD